MLLRSNSNQGKKYEMTKATLSIQGMMCGNCQKHVASALNELEGVSDVCVSLEDESANFTYDESITNVETIKASFADTNYEVA